jgi:hypothetical protein
VYRYAFTIPRPAWRGSPFTAFNSAEGRIGVTVPLPKSN